MPMTIPKIDRATAFIDRRAITNNIKIAQSISPSAKIMAVVKANGYGHGMDNVCYALENADAFGVASIEEAMEIRSLGIMVPILLLEGTLSLIHI